MSELRHNQEIRDLSFKLTNEETIDRGREQARLLEEIEAKTEERKLAAKRAKDEIDALAKRVAELAEVIRSGIEYRPVVCTWSKQEHGSLMVLHRDDTLDKVETRAMTESERQFELE